MVFISDRDKLEKELEEIELFLYRSERFTPEVGNKYIRRDEIKKILKKMGKKDWL